MSFSRRAISGAYASRLSVGNAAIGLLAAALTIPSPPPNDSTVRWQAYVLGLPCIALFLFMAVVLNSGGMYFMAGFSTLMFFLTRKQGL